MSQDGNPGSSTSPSIQAPSACLMRWCKVKLLWNQCRGIECGMLLAHRTYNLLLECTLRAATEPALPAYNCARDEQHICALSSYWQGSRCTR